MRLEKAEMKPSARFEVARLISGTIHPIGFPLLTLGIVTYTATNSLVEATRWVALALALTSLPIALLVSVQVLRRHWTDLDVSVRRQRYALYPFGLACLIALAAAMAHLGAPPVAVRVTVALTLANVIDGLINFGYKVSAHATSAAICATVLVLAAPLLWGVLGTVGALLVGWSRVELRRHTPGQVLLGWSVGLLSTLGLFFGPLAAAHAPLFGLL